MKKKKININKILLASTIALASTVMIGSAAFADIPSTELPVGAYGSIGTTVGNTMTIDQSSVFNAYDWTSFNVGSAATVNFGFSQAGSLALNRVTGGGASYINGTIGKSTTPGYTNSGTVVLVNPNGVCFGQTARVNLGNLTVSTANSADPNLESFEKSVDLANLSSYGIYIANGANITASGNIILNSGAIYNNGTIESTAGSVYITNANSLNTSNPLYASGTSANNAYSVYNPSGNIEHPTIALDSDGIIKADEGDVNIKMFNSATSSAYDNAQNLIVNLDGIVYGNNINISEGGTASKNIQINGGTVGTPTTLTAANGSIDISTSIGDVSSGSIIAKDNVKLSASTNITLDTSATSTTSTSLNGGNITFGTGAQLTSTTGNIILKTDSRSNTVSGNAGNITFNGTSAITAGSAIRFRSRPNGDTGNGNGGNITFSGNANLTATNSDIDFLTNNDDLNLGVNQGNGGNIEFNGSTNNLTADDDINFLTGSFAVKGSCGNAGHIKFAGNTTITSGKQVAFGSYSIADTTTSTTVGNGGNLIWNNLTLDADKVFFATASSVYKYADESTMLDDPYSFANNDLKTITDLSVYPNITFASTPSLVREWKPSGLAGSGSTGYIGNSTYVPGESHTPPAPPSGNLIPDNQGIGQGLNSVVDSIGSNIEVNNKTVGEIHQKTDGVFGNAESERNNSNANSGNPGMVQALTQPQYAVALEGEGGLGSISVSGDTVQGFSSTSVSGITVGNELPVSNTVNTGSTGSQGASAAPQNGAYGSLFGKFKNIFK